MSQSLAYLVSFHVTVDHLSSLLTYGERVFLSESKADEYALNMNKGNPDGFEYVCPAEGTKEWHQYFIEAIVLEDKE
jgi:hypothetical protein